MTDDLQLLRVHSMPIPVTPIVGREDTLRSAREWLARPDVRCLTLTGAGGVGKTRLALAIVAEAAADPTTGIVTVDLAPLRDARLVLPAIAALLGVEGDGADPLVDCIAASLEGAPLLLLLDNLEQLLAVVPVLEELLAACAGLTFLATSRTPLRLAGERTIEIAPLALPDPDRLTPLRDLERTASVGMFVQCARQTDPGFVLDAANAGAVAAVCVRLEGLPLALELAARRLQVLSPATLRDRLSSRLDLLTRGGRALPERHQTLRSTIEWSYDLLDGHDRTVFQRLAVFAGGCDLAAAEFVADTNPIGPATGPPGALHQSLDALAELLDAGLLRRDSGPDGTRFTMLETIREYAGERLESSGEAGLVRTRHADFFAGLADEAEPALAVGLVRGHWPDRLEREHPNLRAALIWSLDGPEFPTGLRLTAALVWFWWIRGHLAEGGAWLERALGLTSEDRTALRAKLLDGAGKLARTRGDLERAAELHQASLEIADELDDAVCLTRALANLALVAEAEHDRLRASRLFERALGSARASGQADMLAGILTNYGLMQLASGDADRGEALLGEGLVIARGLGPSGLLGALLSNLGDARLDRDDPEAAWAMYRECLALQSELGNQRGLADALLGIATVVLRRRDHAFAVRLAAGAEALYASIRAEPPPAAQRLFDDVRIRSTDNLGEAAFADAWAVGHDADVATIVAGILIHGPVSPATAPNPAFSGLTARELDVLRLLAQGHSNRDIADALYISPQTAATHVKRLRAKIGVSTRTAAAAFAHRNGLE